MIMRTRDGRREKSANKLTDPNFSAEQRLQPWGDVNVRATRPRAAADCACG